MFRPKDDKDNHYSNDCHGHHSRNELHHNNTPLLTVFEKEQPHIGAVFLEAVIEPDNHSLIKGMEVLADRACALRRVVVENEGVELQIVTIVYDGVLVSVVVDLLSSKDDLGHDRFLSIELSLEIFLCQKYFGLRWFRPKS